MAELFVDYSGGQLTGSAIANATFNGQHFTGAIRYIDSPANLGGKHTTLAEYRSLIAAGLKVQMVFELGTNDSAGGWNAGVANATRAKAGCDYLGYGGVVFFCNDQTSLPNVAAWTSYLDGAASVLGAARVGAYGFANAITAARGHNAATWQSGAQSSLVAGDNAWQWNNGNTVIAGIPCDVNYIYSYYSPGDEMTPDQDAVLRELLTQFVGSPNVGQYPGWPSFKNPNTKLTVTDFVRWIDVNVVNTQAAVVALDAKVTALAAPVAPVVDVNALAAAITPLVVASISDGIATSVAAELERRLAS